jgi:hypothetical protein
VDKILTCLDSIWDCDPKINHDELTTVYQRLVKLLPLLANAALDIQPQMQALERCTRVGSDAFVSAVMAGNLTLAFETLELAQGIIWSQSLHHRDPQLQNVPKQQALQLEDLLRTMAMKPVVRSHDEKRPWLTPQDIRHVESSQLYALVREIRALPGLSRFMLGETYEALCGTASNYPVITLVGARGRFYALVIASSQVHNPLLLPLDLTEEDCEYLTSADGSTRARRDGHAVEES